MKESTLAAMSVLLSLSLAGSVAGQAPEGRSNTRLPAGTQAAAPAGKPLIRVGAVQTERRTIDYRLKKPADVVAAVDKNLDELEKIVHKAGEAKCDVLTLPEDTLGLLDWGGMNEAAAKEVLPEAVKRMLDRLGRAAAKHRMYLVVCSDLVEADGKTYNTAFFLGRDGKEIGRYHKVCPTWSESGSRERGQSFPVFPTPDLGTVGMLICYDLVFPETARCLALQGADIIFFPTMGGAAVGDDDIGVQALRVRAAENHTWLVVAHRGHGAMIISPRGKIIARAEGADGLAIADIDPHGGREGGDSSNHQKDMRARLFRERNPEAFKMLTEPNPPVLAKAPIDITREEAGRIFARMLTVGEEEFNHAAALADAGKTSEATAAFERLQAEYRGSWIDRVATQRLAQLRSATQGAGKPDNAGNPPQGPQGLGLAAKYPGDVGIERDPAVLFTENFETGAIAAVGKRWGDIGNKEGKVLALSNDVPSTSAGQRSLQMTATLGQNSGGHLYTRLKRGADTAFVRFYVKFAPKQFAYYCGAHLGGYNPPTPWAQGNPGRPRGDERMMVEIMPTGEHGKHAPPGAWAIAGFWPDMKRSADGQYWGNNLTPARPALVASDRWQCVEVMLKCNSAPDQSDGELALWLDGKPQMHVKPGVRRGPWSGMGFSLAEQGGEAFEGFRWRTSNDLKVNFFWLLYNVVTPNPASPVSRVWYDDIVVSTAYVGPIQK